MGLFKSSVLLLLDRFAYRQLVSLSPAGVLHSFIFNLKCFSSFTVSTIFMEMSLKPSINHIYLHIEVLAAEEVLSIRHSTRDFKMGPRKKITKHFQVRSVMNFVTSPSGLHQGSFS